MLEIVTVVSSEALFCVIKFLFTQYVVSCHGLLLLTSLLLAGVFLLPQKKWFIAFLMHNFVLEEILL